METRKRNKVKPTKVIKKVGRPLAITENVVQKLESILKVGGTIEQACNYAEVGKVTYYDELKRNEDFRTKMEKAKDYLAIASKNVVGQAITKDKNLSAAQWYLERKHPEEFGNKPQVLQQINVGGEMGVEFTEGGPDD